MFRSGGVRVFRSGDVRVFRSGHINRIAQAIAGTVRVWMLFAFGVGAASGLAIGLDRLGANDAVRFALPLCVLIAVFGVYVSGTRTVLDRLGQSAALKTAIKPGSWAVETAFESRLPAAGVSVVLAIFVVSLVLMVELTVVAASVDDATVEALLRGLSVVAGVFLGTSIAVLLVGFLALEQLVSPIREAMDALVQRFESVANGKLEAAKKVEEAARRISEERESGLHRQYRDRRLAFIEIFEAVKTARTRIMFLGISNRIFAELRGIMHHVKDPDQEFCRDLLEAMKRGCRVEFLYLARSSVDLYLIRERAETDAMPSSAEGSRLFQETRHSLNRYTLPLYFDAVQAGVEERLSILEYELLPTLSIVMVDDRMFVGPYAARECKDIPVQEYRSEARAVGQEPYDYMVYYQHYKKYSDASRRVVPPAFSESWRPTSDECIRRLHETRSELEDWISNPHGRGPYERLLDWRLSPDK